MEMIKISLKVPTAHFSVPYALSQKKTYPIPPYSTVIGFICNILAEREKIGKFLSKPLSLAIVGNYESIVHEYTWFRSLIRGAAGKLCRKSLNGEVEHPGMQIPVRVQTLFGVSLSIYIKASGRSLDMLENSFKLGNYIYPLHIGRAEDVISEITLERIEPKIENALYTGGYTWIPAPSFFEGSHEDYEKFYRKVPGIADKINAIYKIENGFRSFNRIDVKLYNGGLPMTSPYATFKTFSDGGIPIFLAKVVK